MGFWTKISNEIARKHGFEAGVKGEAPRFSLAFESSGHREAYLEGYKMGQESVTARAIHMASEKFLK